MSKTLKAIAQKNAYEKRIKDKKNTSILNMRREALFRIRVRKSMQKIDELLKDEDVEYVVIKVAKEDIKDFERSVYSEDMKFYEIVKKESQEGYALYRISLKEIKF